MAHHRRSASRWRGLSSGAATLRWSRVGRRWSGIRRCCGGSIRRCCGRSVRRGWSRIRGRWSGGIRRPIAAGRSGPPRRRTSARRGWRCRSCCAFRQRLRGRRGAGRGFRLNGFGSGRCSWFRLNGFGGSRCSWFRLNGFGGGRCSWLRLNGFGGGRCSWLRLNGHGSGRRSGFRLNRHGSGSGRRFWRNRRCSGRRGWLRRSRRRRCRRGDGTLRWCGGGRLMRRGRYRVRGRRRSRGRRGFWWRRCGVRRRCCGLGRCRMSGRRFRLSVRTDFGLCLRHNQRCGLGVRRRACELHRRKSRRGEQHETKFCHDGLSSPENY